MRPVGGQGAAPAAGRRGRWLIWLTVSVAVMAAAGYLVAALVLFPAPILPNERVVVQVQGLGAEDALRELERAGLTGAVLARQSHARIPLGMVIWQDPPAGVALPRGDSVRLVVSAGPPKIAVPDVRGYDLDLAQRLITAAGLRLELVDTVAMKSTPAGLAPSGMVGGTTPAMGDSVVSGGGVTVHIVQ